MAIVLTQLPVRTLSDLSSESRMISTPWSRIVRGLGLGQYPIDFDPVAAARLRHAFDLLEAKVNGSHAYTFFAARLADFILTVADPAGGPSQPECARRLEAIIDAVRLQENPYYSVMAGCILMDACAKLGLDQALLVNDVLDLPGEILGVVDAIEPDRIKDENSGRHGEYERLSAYTSVFLAFGQLGLQDRLVGGSRHHVKEALNLLDKVPAPFFRGRGGSMLFSVISLLGYDAQIFDAERDYMADMFGYLDRADELNLPPRFPQPMSDAFAKIYPLVTLLNSVAMSGRPEYLTFGRDRLAEIKSLWAAITPVERTHMALYYIMALHNLGRLQEQFQDTEDLVEGVIGEWRNIDPGANFFLHGISYAYIMQMAMVTGRSDLISENALDRMVDAFPDLDRTEMDRSNRPYPFSYALNVLGEIGVSDMLFAPRRRYAGHSSLAWVIGQLSHEARAERGRLYMLDNALMSYALRLRGRQSRETELFKSFRFRLAS